MSVDESAGPAAAPISRSERESANGHKAGILWLTGLPAAGKSTLAAALGRFLFDRGYQVTVLDGDRLRAGLNANVGFSREGRSENVRRVGEVAGLFMEAGFLVIVALISPYRADRARLRAAYPGEYHEIYVSTPLEICEARDPKGHYKLARDGTIGEFTGISAPYEPPLSPDLIVDTAHARVDQNLKELFDYVHFKVPLDRSPVRLRESAA